MRRVTSDRSIVGKLTVNLGAANDAAIVSNTAAGGITVNGNPPASQQVSWRRASSSPIWRRGGATVSIPGRVGALGIESLAVVTETVKLAAQDEPAKDQSLIQHAAVG